MSPLLILYLIFKTLLFMTSPLYVFYNSTFLALSHLVTVPSLCLPSHSEPTDALDEVRAHGGDDAVDGGRGEDEEEGRAGREQLHSGVVDDDDDAFAAAAAATATAAASSLVTYPLPPEAHLPATSGSQPPLGFTNPGSELTSLGKRTNRG